MKPQQAGRVLIISGERGDIENFPGSKLLLAAGGANYVSTHIANQKRAFELANGKTYHGRRFSAPVKTEDEDDDQGSSDNPSGDVESSSSLPNWLDEKVLPTTDHEAVNRAIHFLQRKVPGYIWGRLLIVAEQNPERVAELANELKKEIDDMVGRLV